MHHMLDGHEDGVAQSTSIGSGRRQEENMCKNETKTKKKEDTIKEKRENKFSHRCESLKSHRI